MTKQATLGILGLFLASVLATTLAGPPAEPDQDTDTLKKAPKPIPGDLLCKPEKIKEVNGQPRDYRTTAFMKTTRGLRSEAVARHQSPDRTHIDTLVRRPGGEERRQATVIKNFLYMQAANGETIKIDRSQPLEGPIAGLGGAIDHEQFGPPGLTRDVEQAVWEFLGIGACEGAVDAGGKCVAYRFKDGPQDSVAYFSVSDCLVRAASGGDDNGPLRFVFEYGPQSVEVPGGTIHELTGDMSRDLPVLMKLMTGSR